ncbi:hypothetical protein POM88_018074 [Heracleum sosnowskyi]|uniref:Reverse transcriptase zinc-binding domain-containing protein n=1 Tax=Heracleum sosnowskyi TaxID=360622 RepID=A0AAD8MYT2_9APIA|nr:hypothetical protein POM88_018074 [Heracleum sosnowskyi]
MGARKTVGYGLNISILEDPWFPYKTSAYVVSNHQALAGQTVCSLFKETDRIWDDGILRDLFFKKDIKLIRSIQLSSSADEDFWLWNKDVATRSFWELQQKEVPVAVGCPFCVSATESAWHLFLDCLFAKSYC